MKKEFLSKLKRFSQQTFIPKQFRQPAVPQRFSPSDDSQAFSLNGFLVKQITQSSTFDQMFTSLRNFASPTPPSPFLWEKKSEGYYLLRPKPTEYSSVFVDFLFDNGVMDLISEITGQNLYLADISFIHHTPGIQNDWHRDTYIYDDQPVGPFPAIFKMIYYPLLGLPPKPQLHVIPGSHRRVYFDRVTDESQISSKTIQTISSSDHQFVFFDSTILHAVHPESRPEGSYRLHFQFARRSQLDERYSMGKVAQQQFENRLLTHKPLDLVR